jgi:integrase
MSVHRNSAGHWFIQWRDKKTKKLKHKFFGKGPEGEAAAREAWEKIGVRRWGKYSQRQSPPFVEVVRAYLLDKQHDLEESTLAGMVPKIKGVILPALGELPASQIDEAVIQRYITERAAKVKLITIRRELADIRAVLNWAVKKKILLENPMAGVTWPRNDSERIRPPSADEIRALLEAAPHHLKRVLILSWYLGLRVGEELLSRRWHDVDWDNQVFFIESAKKHGLDTRRVPIAEEVFPLLLQWYIEDGENGERHIITWRGRPVKKIKTAWIAAKKKAGITRRLRPYDIRHAFVSDLLASGANPTTVGEVVGHKDKSTTLYVYNHTTDNQHREAVNKRKSIL